MTKNKQKQLEWLSKELHAAEFDSDKVHIIGHIPPDNRECTQAWLFNYLRIIDRFQDTVLASYFGHTHRDEFRVLLSPYRKPTPISVAYIGPSITSFTENNPGYRVYYTDQQGYMKDHETFFFDLSDANKAGSTSDPIWRRGYNAFDQFNLTNLGPFGWHRLVHQMIDDDHLFQNYFKYDHLSLSFSLTHFIACTLLSSLFLSFSPFSTSCCSLIFWLLQQPSKLLITPSLSLSLLSWYIWCTISNISWF